MIANDRSKSDSPVLTAPDEQEMARVAQRCLMAALDHSRAASILLTTDSGKPEQIAVPPAALKLIGQLLGLMSEGRVISLIPSTQEFSTVEAANYLNVSRPFVIKEIEAGRLKSRKVGTHRRITFEDLQSYETTMRAEQHAALDRLAENAEKLGLDY